MWTQALVRSLTQSGVPLQSGGRGQKGAGPMAVEGKDCEWRVRRGGVRGGGGGDEGRR